MTESEQKLSYHTVKHLDAWLARNVRDPDETIVAKLRENMLRLTASDEVYWLNQGWWRVYANCPTD